MELKPCPFCGGKAVEMYIKRHLMYRLFNRPNITHFVYIKCRNCATTSRVSETREEAIEAWNRRVGEEETT